MPIPGSSSNRLVVVCKVTEECNLGCAFCGYDRTLERARRTADSGRLRQLAPQLAAIGAARGLPVLTSWLGGEPMLWPELPALTSTFRRHGLAVSVTTNGTTLGSPDVRAHVLDEYAEITVSIDGLSARHDRLRRWPGGFARVEEAIGRLVAERDARGSRLLIRVNTVVMRDNLDELPALWHHVAGWGIDEITWNQLGGIDRPEFFPAHRLRPEDAVRLAAMLPGLQQALPERTRLRGGAEYLDRALASSRGQALPVDDCAAGDRFLFVSLDGMISPCSFTARTLGVGLEALDDVLALPTRLASRKREVRPAACADCHSTQVFGKFSQP